jgi:transposase
MRLHTQWTYLVRYVDDRQALMDNNVIERDIWPFAIDRKNWTLTDFVVGARGSSLIQSIVLTRRACNVESYVYLCHVLTELLQRPPNADISELLPFSFKMQHIATFE